MNDTDVRNAVGLVTLHVVITDESAWNRADYCIMESISAKRYGLWQYNYICLQGRKEHTAAEGRMLCKVAGV